MKNTTYVKSTPKDVFLHLLNIVTFFQVVISFITLYIQYISALFPDQLNFYFTNMANAVRVSTSILLIALPVYILTSWLLGKDLISRPERRELTLRKILIYLTLFVAAITIIIDLIMLVYNFLSGEISVQFFLKIFVVLLVAVAVFGYHIWDLRRKNMKSKTPKILAWILSFVAIASIVIGFLVVGTPGEQRQRRFDDQRVSDLSMVQYEIVNYWQRKEALPQELSTLEDSISGFMTPKDPDSKASYEYNIINELSFELCAEFKTSSKGFNGKSPSYYDYGFGQQNWEHEAERTCFERIIDPDLYKTNEGPKIPVPVRD